MVSDPRPGWSPGPATSRPVDELDFAMTWRKISGHNQVRPIDLVKLCRANFGRLIFNWQVWSVSGSGRPVDFGEFLPAARTISCGPPFELHHGQAFFIIENQRLIVVTPENRNHPPSVIQKPSPISACECESVNCSRLGKAHAELEIPKTGYSSRASDAG